MPSFLHKTLRRSSYLLNVLEGCWLPNIENNQFIFNYGTSFEIFKFLPPNLLEPIYFQPFFDRVRFICSGPQTSNISLFYALRENDVVEYRYHELEGFFVASNRFTLPKQCNNPTFAVHTHTHLIISSTHGCLCSIDLINGEIKSFKTSECILHAFAFSSKQFLFRIESGPKTSIYTIPDINLFKSKSSPNIKYAFPYRDSSYVIFQSNTSLHNTSIQNTSIQNNSTDYDLSESDDDSPCFTIIFPNERTISLEYPPGYSIANNENVIDHAVISPTSTIILTENGHLLQLIDDKFEYIGTYKHSYRIFILNATELLIARHGLDHIILDLLYKNVACQQESFSSILNFTVIPGFNSNITTNINNKEEIKDDSMNDDSNDNSDSENSLSHQYIEPYNRSLATMTNSSFIISRYGIEVENLSSFDSFEDEITGLFSFIHINIGTIYYAVSYSQGITQILEYLEENNSISICDDPLYRTDVCTIGFLSLNPYFLFQFYKEGFTFYSQDSKHDVLLKNSTVVTFASTKNELICIFSDQTAIQSYVENLELRFSKHFNLSFETTCVSILESCKLVIFGTKENMLYSYNMTNDVELINIYPFLKVPSTPVSLHFTSKEKLLIGFEDGTVACGSIDVKLMKMRDNVLISIGDLPVRFSSDKFAISSSLFLLSDKNDIFETIPLNNKINPEFAVSIDFDKYLMASKHKIYAMKINNKKVPKMQNSRIEIKNEIIECIPINKANSSQVLLVASNKDISLLDLNELTAHQIFVFDENEKFNLMTPIDLEKNKICLVTQLSQFSNLRIIDFKGKSVIDDCHVSFELQISEKIGSVCGYKGGILIGVDNSILFYKKNQNDGYYRILSRTTEIGTGIASIIANNDFIFVGDRQLSVLILEYVESFQNFRIIGQEPALRRVLSLFPYKSSVVGGDIEGNIFTFDDLSKIISDLSSSFSMFKGNRRLPIKMCYNVGEVVTKVSSINDNDKKMMQITYSTINGGFGALLEKEKDSLFTYKMDLEGKFKTLLSLQIIIEEQLLKLAAIDHFAFRNRLYPSEVVIDLDIINMYLNFSDNKKERVAKEVSSSLCTHQIEILISFANQLFCSIC